MKLRTLRCLVTLAAGALPAAAWAQGAMGPEFRVNTFTTSSQLFPTVASDGNGDFVATWGSSTQDGSGAAVIGRRFDAAGAPLGPEFQVNTFTTSTQNAPAAAASADGSFVVVWNSFAQDGDGLGIFGRRFAADGTPLTGEFPVNTYTSTDQYVPDVAADANGSFVAVWASTYQDGNGTGIIGRQYDALGAPTAEFQVNTYTTGNQFYPAVASAAAGTFLVVWRGAFQDGSGDGIFGRVFGSGLDSEFQINTYTTGDQSDPAVAADGNGNFVVAWQSYGQDGNNRGVFARRLSPTGTPLGGEFQVNTYTTGSQAYVDLAADRDGSFTVAWTSTGEDGSQQGVYARQYDATGTPLGGEFRVNTYTSNSQERPAVAAVADGDFALAWHSNTQDGDSTGIFGQRYGDLIFRDGVETGDVGRWTSAETDGTDLSVLPEAALGGTSLGLRALVDDTNPLFVRDDNPAAEDQYRARFYFDTNGFDPGEATSNRRVRLLIAFNAANQRLATIVLRRLGGQYALMGRARLDDGTRADTGFFPITDGAHMVELRWQRSSATPDGFFILRIDDVQVSSLTGLDNGDSAVEYARLGVMSIKSPAAGGTMYFDQFESRRARRIGPE